MPRIRTIKPDFWDSPATAKASLRARLFYIAMWNWADDWGVGDANPKRLLSFAFPNDESSDVEPRNFRRLAEEVAECFNVVWYEVAGREYYSIPKWEKHQRAEKKAQRYNPAFDQDFPILYGSASDNPPLDSGTIDAGNRKSEVGNGEKEEEPSSAIAVAIPRHDVEQILDALDRALVANGGKPAQRNKKNTDAARLMLDKDGIPLDHVLRAIAWALNDEFWRTNILSISKLREKYEQLRLKAEQKKNAQLESGATHTGVDRAIELAQLYREEETHGEV